MRRTQSEYTTILLIIKMAIEGQSDFELEAVNLYNSCSD